MQVIGSENGRLLEQVERMLHIAKVDQGEYQMHWESLNLPHLVEEVVGDMHIQIAEKNGEIELHKPDTPIWIEGDRLHLSNVIRNLLDNALKYCDQQPHILISLFQNSKQAILKFQDNGIGICEDQRALIFDPFPPWAITQKCASKRIWIRAFLCQKGCRIPSGFDSIRAL